MAVADYEFSWVVITRDPEHLIGQKPKKPGPPKKPRELRLSKRRRNRRKKKAKQRQKVKSFYERHPELSQPRHTDEVFPKDFAQEFKQKMLEERYLIGPQNSAYLQKQKRKERSKRDPYWSGLIVEHNGTKYFQWRYAARKLNRSPATFEHMTEKGVIPKCMYVLGKRNWLYYSEHQYKLLRYAMKKLGPGKGAWKREDAAKFLFENWVKNEPIS